MTATFQQVLHQWAARQLQDHSGHQGPFEIIRVQLLAGAYDYDPDDTEDVTLEIAFQHDGVACDEAWRRVYSGHGAYLLDRCTITTWHMPHTATTVDMLNQLLNTPDEKGKPR